VDVDEIRRVRFRVEPQHPVEQFVGVGQAEIGSHPRARAVTARDHPGLDLEGTVGALDADHHPILALLDAGDGVALLHRGARLAGRPGESPVQFHAVDGVRHLLVLVEGVRGRVRAAEVKPGAVDVVLEQVRPRTLRNVLPDVEADVARTGQRRSDLTLLEDDDVAAAVGRPPGEPAPRGPGPDDDEIPHTRT
jgi:hypothetical protein